MSYKKAKNLTKNPVFDCPKSNNLTLKLISINIPMLK